MFSLKDFVEPGDSYRNFVTGESFTVPEQDTELIITKDDDGSITVGIWDTEEEGKDTVRGVTVSISLEELLALIDEAVSE